MGILNIYECPQCKNKITLPLEITEKDQEEIAQICRAVSRIDAWRTIREKFNLGLTESKVIMAHISMPKDHCTNCSNTLLETGITYCPSCSGLNFNW